MEKNPIIWPLEEGCFYVVLKPSRPGDFLIIRGRKTSTYKYDMHEGSSYNGVDVSNIGTTIRNLGTLTNFCFKNTLTLWPTLDDTFQTTTTVNIARLDECIIIKLDEKLLKLLYSEDELYPEKLPW